LSHHSLADSPRSPPKSRPYARNPKISQRCAPLFLQCIFVTIIQVHLKHKTDGPKFKKQASLVEISAKTLEGELSTITATIAAIDAKLADQSTKRKTFDESRADLALQVHPSLCCLLLQGSRFQ
jgi:hypothetical protein